MSGFEVAGIALAVLPLLVSAAQNYNKSLEPFWRYRGFPNEAQRFLKLLKIQRTIFRNHCAILLGNFINQDAALGLLQTPLDQTPQNFKLEKGLDKLLKDSKEACIDTIELIISRLTAIERECRDLVVAVNSEKSSETYISWKNRITTKLRFSVSRSRLNEHLESLQTLNDNFKTLAFQSLRLEEKRPSRDGDGSKTARREIEKFEAVRKASSQIHEALRRACTIHAEHLAHTGVEVEYVVSKDSYSPQVKFQMVLAAPTNNEDYISFIVDTTLEDVLSPDSSAITPDSDTVERSSKRYLCKPIDDNVHVKPYFDEPERSLKRYLRKPTDVDAQKIKENAHVSSSAASTTALLPPITIAGSLFFDGHQSNDFCERLRQCRSHIEKRQVCVGTLETAIGYHASIFLSTANSMNGNQHATSLGQLISTLSDPQTPAGFPLYQRLGLAKVLATAVLQYRATPWLQLSWKSNDVVFFPTGEQKDNSSLGRPHFNTRIDSRKQVATLEEQRALKTATEARNPLLYSLGIVLFEIGCWRVADSCSDLTQARQLLRSGRSSGRFEMGPRYDEIVEKLIECDFGCGADLNKAGLQTAVYRDVICPLEKLESDFRALQLGS